MLLHCRYYHYHRGPGQGTTPLPQPFPVPPSPPPHIAKSPLIRGTHLEHLSLSSLAQGLALNKCGLLKE